MVGLMFVPFERRNVSFDPIKNVHLSKCEKCGKTVYYAEEIKIEGRSWHKDGCFRCSECNTMLEKGKQQSAKNDSKIYCKGCYSKNYGPKGFGYGGSMVGNYDKKNEQ